MPADRPCDDPVDGEQIVGWLAELRPAAGAAAIARQLLSLLRSTGGAGRGGLLWKCSPAGDLQGVAAGEDDQWAEFRLPPDEASSLFSGSAEAARRYAGLIWSPLPAPAQLTVFVGGESPAALSRIPESWRSLTPLLLTWGVDWEQRLELQKLSALAEFAAGAGHEINNPLVSIIGRASQLRKLESDPEKQRLLETIGAQAYRIRDMIGDVMLYARPPAPRTEPLDLGEVVKFVAAKFESAAAEKHVRLVRDLADDVQLAGDRDQLSVVVSELLRNAIEAVPTGGEMMLECHLLCGAGRNWACLAVVDNGPGLTEDQLEHCFDPYFSGRQAGRGLGFGLSKCWRIVEQHGGRIALSSHSGQTRAEVWLPAGAARD